VARAMGVEACVVACRFASERAGARVIVDPFCGLGTALAVANTLGLDGVGRRALEEASREGARADGAAVSEASLSVDAETTAELSPKWTGRFLITLVLALALAGTAIAGGQYAPPGGAGIAVLLLCISAVIASIAAVLATFRVWEQRTRRRSSADSS